jgi:hypothetical protein
MSRIQCGGTWKQTQVECGFRLYVDGKERRSADCPDMIPKRHIRPSLKQIEGTKRIGFHSVFATDSRMPQRDHSAELSTESLQRKAIRRRTESWDAARANQKARKDRTLQHR